MPACCATSAGATVTWAAADATMSSNISAPETTLSAMLIEGVQIGQSGWQWQIMSNTV